MGKEKDLRFENRKQAAGYTNIENFVLKNREIPYKSRFLYILLLSYARQDGECFPGQTRLGKDVGVSQKTIRRWLSDLETQGLIDIVQRGLNKTNLYIIKDLYRTPVSDRSSASGQERSPGSDNELTVIQKDIYSVADKQADQNKVSLETRQKIISYLNKKINASYKPSTKTTISHINARFSEGFTIEDFYSVIAKKVAEWKGTEYERYLRPQTLFGTKFESYLNQKVDSSSDPFEGRKFI